MVAENWKRLLLSILVFYVISYLCVYITFLYNLLAYFGYVAITMVLSWTLAKQLRLTQKAKEKVPSIGKAVFITGCDSGFGHRLAIALDKLGFTVFAGVLFPDKEGAAALRQKCSKSLKIVKIDVTSSESVEEAALFVGTNLGSKELWALVNNAGIIEYCAIELGQNIGSFERQMNVNTFGLVRTTKAFLPLMRNNKTSRIVLLGSLAGRFVPPAMCGYSMTKYAVRAFGEGLRREMKQFGIYVSVVEPAFYKTAISDESVALKQLDKFYQESSEDVRDVYSENFDNFKDIVSMFLNTTHDRLEDVTETLCQAIQSPEPEFYYPICYFFDKITLLMDKMPEELSDCITNETVGPWVLRLIRVCNDYFGI